MKSLLSMLVLGGTALVAVGSVDLGAARPTVPRMPDPPSTDASSIRGAMEITPVRDAGRLLRFAQQRGTPSPLAPVSPSTSGGSAGAVITLCGKLSVWVPDDWQVTPSGSSLEAESDDLTLAAGPFTADFISDQLDSAKTTTDRREKLDRFDVRLLEGTGTEEDDDEEDAQFRALALDPGTGEAAIAVIVYGTAENMTKAQSVVDRVLHSLRPGRPSPQVCG